MVLTKKEHLTKEYLKFIQEIKSVVDCDIFPSLDEVDITDILLFFNITFVGLDDYSDIIKNLMHMNHYDITDEQFNIVIPIITKYINDLKLFLKTQ
jgi:hypothetical protein